MAEFLLFLIQVAGILFVLIGIFILLAVLAWLVITMFVSIVSFLISLVRGR